MALTQSVAHFEGSLYLIEDAPRKGELRDLVVAGNNAQIDDPAFVSELSHWLRFSESAAQASADGLFAGCSGNPAMLQWLCDIEFAWFLVSGGNRCQVPRICHPGR